MLKKLKEHKTELAIAATLVVSGTVLFALNAHQQKKAYDHGIAVASRNLSLIADSAGLLDQLIEHQSTLRTLKV